MVSYFTERPGPQVPMDHYCFLSNLPGKVQPPQPSDRCTKGANGLVQAEGWREAGHVPPREQDQRPTTEEGTEPREKTGSPRITHETLKLEIWAV